MKPLVLAIAVLVAAATSPALAYPNCLSGGGFSVSIGAGFGELSEADAARFDLMRLRRRGIDAQTAERTWLDCLKVTRIENGSWVTEYYDPRTYEQVY